MSDLDLDKTVLVATGVSVRAEQVDRPLAYRIAEAITDRLGTETVWQPLVISDVYYLNTDELHRCPVISVGGPGVNRLSAVLFREIPSVLTIDNILIIQMDARLKDRRCCLWGMNHDQTVEALDLFLKLGHLDRFLAGITGIETGAADL